MIIHSTGTMPSRSCLLLLRHHVLGLEMLLPIWFPVWDNNRKITFLLSHFQLSFAIEEELIWENLKFILADLFVLVSDGRETFINDVGNSLWVFPLMQKGLNPLVHSKALMLQLFLNLI